MDPTPMLVVGAQGAVGSQLVPLLLARGHKVHAATPEGPGGAEATGMKTVRLDLGDARAALAALAKVQAVAVASGGEGEPSQEELARLVAAAGGRGVKVVLISRQDAALLSDDSPLGRIDRQVRELGAPHIVLRSGWLMDDFHTLWRRPLAEGGELAVPAGEGRAAFVAARDVAAAAAAALCERRWDGQVLGVTGGDVLSFAEAVRAVGAAAGRQLAYRPVAAAAFPPEAERQGLPAALARRLDAPFAALRAGHFAASEDGVAKLTGGRAQRFADYAALNARAWRRPDAAGPQ